MFVESIADGWNRILGTNAAPSKERGICDATKFMMTDAMQGFLWNDDGMTFAVASFVTLELVATAAMAVSCFKVVLPRDMPLQGANQH